MQERLTVGVVTRSRRPRGANPRMDDLFYALNNRIPRRQGQFAMANTTLTKEERRKKEAAKIIHTAATSAASASALGGLIPGGSLGVEALLTGVTVAMVIKLGGLFGRSITKTVAHDILTVVSGMVVGKLALNSVLTWIPGVASAAAATISFTFHETAGWIVYEGFEKGTW